MEETKKKMVSAILGWLLVALGIVSYVVGMIMFARSQSLKPTTMVSGQSITDPDLETIKEILDKLSAMMESFGKLSIPVQWAILGLLNIGIGSYLLANRPF